MKFRFLFEKGAEDRRFFLIMDAFLVALVVAKIWQEFSGH